MSNRQRVTLASQLGRLSIEGALRATSRSGQLLCNVIVNAALRRRGVCTIRRQLQEIVFSVERDSGITPNRLAMDLVMELQHDFPGVDFQTFPA